MPTLLFPAALAALVGLAVPLIIHLARRSEQRLTPFAALRWLAPKPRPRSRLRFDEWPLLVVRLLLVTLVVVWLARPARDGNRGSAPWVAVVPGILDPVVAATAEGHWLAPGFPTLDQTAPDGPQPVASLLRQLDAELPRATALTVEVPAQLAGIDAERLRLSRPVVWRVMPGSMPVIAVGARRWPVPSVRYAPEAQGEVRYFRAAALAAAPAGAFDAKPASDPLPPTGNLVWLVPGPLPAAVSDWIRRGGTALLAAAVRATPPLDQVVWRDDVGGTLVTGGNYGRGRVLQLTRRLDPGPMPQLLEPDFPLRLRALFDAPSAPPARIAAVDAAPLTGGIGYRPPTRDLQPWLALMIAAMLIVERWLATARRTTS